MHCSSSRDGCTSMMRKGNAPGSMQVPLPCWWATESKLSRGCAGSAAYGTGTSSSSLAKNLDSTGPLVLE